MHNSVFNRLPGRQAGKTAYKKTPLREVFFYCCYTIAMEIDTREVVHDTHPQFRRLWLARYDFDLSYDVEALDLEMAGFRVFKLEDPSEYVIGFKFLTKPLPPQHGGSTSFTITRSPSIELTRETMLENSMPGVCFNLDTCREGDTLQMYEEEVTALTGLIRYFESLH